MREFARTFWAMNTDVTVVIAANAARLFEAEVALCQVEMLFADVEGVASRFRRESELSQLNGSSGRPFQASPLLFTLVARALDAARASDGLFDPTVLRPLVAAGYDQSYELLAGDLPAACANADHWCSWRDVRLDQLTRTILMPQGCGLDLGGIGKGWTVDLAARKLIGFANYAIDAGGDILVRGVQCDGRPWTVGLENPFEPENNILTLAVENRAIATSTVARRRWLQSGREQHHLIDPRTRRPSETGVISATVVADSVAHAEVLAKVALLLGPHGGARFLEDRAGIEWLLVLAEGSLRHSKKMSEGKCET